MPPKMAQKRSRDSVGGTKSVTTPADEGATVPIGEEQVKRGETLVIPTADEEPPPSKRSRQDRSVASRESAGNDNGDVVMDEEGGPESSTGAEESNGRTRDASAAATTGGSGLQEGTPKRTSKRPPTTRRTVDENSGQHEEEASAESPPVASSQQSGKRSRKSTTSRSPPSAPTPSPGLGAAAPAAAATDPGPTPAAAAANIYDNVFVSQPPTPHGHQRQLQQQPKQKQQQQQQQQQQQHKQQQQRQQQPPPPPASQQQQQQQRHLRPPHTNGKQSTDQPLPLNGALGGSRSKGVTLSGIDTSATATATSSSSSSSRPRGPDSSSSVARASRLHEQTGVRNDGDASLWRQEQNGVQQVQRPRPESLVIPSPRAANLPAPLHSSPSLTVPPGILRQVTGVESPTGKTGPARPPGAPADVIAGAENRGVAGRFGEWAMRCRGFAWRARSLLEDVNLSTLVSAVRNLTLRLIMLGVTIVGGRLLWEAVFVVMALSFGGLIGRDADANRGPTSRELALELVRLSEPFVGLQALELERRAQVSEMQTRDAQVSDSLLSLRRVQKTLSENMELLRSQAEGGASSRGLPGKSEMSEQIFRSQLEELAGLKTEMQKLVAATRQAVDDGQAWTDEMLFRASNLPPAVGPWGGEPMEEGVIGAAEEERLLTRERAASEAWQEEASQVLYETFYRLENAYQSLRAVQGSRPAGLITMEDATRLLDNVRHAVRSASEELRSEDEEKPTLKERVETATKMLLEAAWSAAAEEEESSSDVNPLQTTMTTLEEVRELVATEVEFFTSGGTGMPDFASVRSGAVVVHGPVLGHDGQEQVLTSPTYPQTILSWPEYVLHSLKVPGHVYGEGPEAALSLDNSLGSCFAFAGGAGRLTLQLASYVAKAASEASEVWAPDGDACSVSTDGDSSCPSPAARERVFGGVKVTHVSLEHPRVAYAPSGAKSALRSFRVLGWDRDPSGEALADLGASDRSGEKEEVATVSPYVLVDRAEYQVGDNAPGVQTFAVSSSAAAAAAALETAPAVKWVTLEVDSNHGGIWTCLYGFRVHGEPVVVEV